MSNANEKNWWVSNEGKNTLEEGVLPEETVLEFLWQNPFARKDFEKIVPTMSAYERERLRKLVQDNPYIKYLMPDPQVMGDKIQSNHNKAGVRLNLPKR